MNRRAAIAAVVVIVVLVAAAWAIARRIGAADAVQDCVMQGRTNCGAAQ